MPTMLDFLLPAKRQRELFACEEARQDGESSKGTRQMTTETQQPCRYLDAYLPHAREVLKFNMVGSVLVVAIKDVSFKAILLGQA